MYKLELENLQEFAQIVGIPTSMQPEEYAWLLFEQRLKIEDSILTESSQMKLKGSKGIKLVDLENDINLYVTLHKDLDIVRLQS